MTAPTVSGDRPADPGQKLKNLPAAAQAAYRRYQESGDQAALDEVIMAIIADFIPRARAESLASPLGVVVVMGAFTLFTALIPGALLPAPPASGSYTVVSGDTLSSIAARFGISTQELLDANGLTWESVIYPGSVLAVPGSSTPASTGGEITMLNDEMRANAAVIVSLDDGKTS